MTPWNDGTGTDPMERRCTAKNRQGERCRKYAIRGGTVCTSHGGRSPAVKAAAARNEALRRAEADARAVLAHEGMEPLGDPVLEMSKVAREIVAMKNALAARVNALASPTYDFMGQERTRAELELYNAALDRTVRVLDLLGKHDLEQRRIAMTENDARLVHWVLVGFLRDLALDFEREQQARALMRQWMSRLVEAVSTGELPAGA